MLLEYSTYHNKSAKVSTPLTPDVLIHCTGTNVSSCTYQDLKFTSDTSRCQTRFYLYTTVENLRNEIIDSDLRTVKM